MTPAARSIADRFNVPTGTASPVLRTDRFPLSACADGRDREGLMRRRSVLKHLAAALAVPTDLTRWFAAPAAAATAFSRLRPGMPDWPTEAEWASLKEAVGGRLEACAPADVDDPAVRRLISNPLDVPARLFWNAEVYRQFAPSAVNFDDRSGASPTDFWWRDDGDQVGVFWHAYTSAWMPASLLEPANRSRLEQGRLVCCQPPLARRLRVQ
jgi:hypothetical protein